MITQRFFFLFPAKTSIHEKGRAARIRNWIICVCFCFVVFALKKKKNIHLKCIDSGGEAHSKATVTRLPQDDRFFSVFGSQLFATDSIRYRIVCASALYRSFVRAMLCSSSSSSSSNVCFYPSRERDEYNTHARKHSHVRRMLTHSY